MKKLLLLCCIAFVGSTTASNNKPTLKKDVEESGFGKAVDAGNFQAALDAFTSNKVSGRLLKKNALEYLYMIADIQTLSDTDQSKILTIIVHTPEDFSSGLSITPSNHKWLMSVAPEYARRTNVVQTPVVPRIPTSQPIVPPAPAVSTDPRQINVPGMPGINYNDIINAWNRGEWEVTVRKLEILHNNVPKSVDVFALQALLKYLLENISYEVWTKIDADPRARLARLAHQYKVKVPQAPAIAPGPGPVLPPDIQGEPAYSYKAVKKAWQNGKWQIVLSNLQNFESNPGVFTDKSMLDILTEMVRDTSSAEWNKIRPTIRHSLETFLKQYGINPPLKPPLPPTPTVDNARTAWTRQTPAGQADSTGLTEALIILETLAKKDPKNAAFKAAVAELVKYANNAYWSNLTPDQPKRIKALAQIARVDEKPLPPLPGPRPLPPTPAKPPVSPPGPLPPVPAPKSSIEALYNKIDIALKKNNVKEALEIILKEAKFEEVKQALTRMLLEVEPRALLIEKDLLKSNFERLQDRDKGELRTTFEMMVQGPDAQALIKILFPAAPLPPALGPVLSSDKKAIEAARKQDFDEAVKTLQRVAAGDDLQKAVTELFTKIKDVFKNDRERDDVLNLLKKAYPDKAEREKFYGTIRKNLGLALRRAEEEEEED